VTIIKNYTAVYNKTRIWNCTIKGDINNNAAWDSKSKN